MMMRICKTCGQEKPESDFYASSRGASCKVCRRLHALKYRWAHIGRVRFYDRQRYRLLRSVRARVRYAGAAEQGRE
jgi:hypothetical protein